MINRIVQLIKLFSSPRKEFYLFLKDLIGFYPRNLKLYDIAFIHKSASHYNSYGMQVNNERLEYLGDAILGAVIADFLFNRFPQQDEGFLTKMRSRLVNRPLLTQLTYEMGLDHFFESNTKNTQEKSHIYGDVLEALIGAIYLDRDFETAKFFITRKILSQYVNLNKIESHDTNYKSMLIEWSQKNKREVKIETIEDYQKGNKQPTFIAVVEIEQNEMGRGYGSSKKEAQQNAAREALHLLQDGL